MNFKAETSLFNRSLKIHFLLFLFTAAVHCNTNQTEGKEKVSELLQSAILFHNAAKTIEDKLIRLQNYKPYEKGMKIMKDFNERITDIQSTMEELKKNAEEHPDVYLKEIETVLMKIDSENDDLIDMMKILGNPQKYYDDNDVVQKIKDDKYQLTGDLKSFDRTAREFMKNIDALEENKIYLYTLEESDIKFEFSIIERLLEMYKQVENYQDQLASFGENIPKDLNRVRNSLNLLTQIEIPTYLVNNGNMLENFVPSIIRSVEHTQEQYSSADDTFDAMFATFLAEVNENKIRLEKFLKLSDELKLLSGTKNTLEKDEL